jgi:hypothetical protein
MAQNLLSKNLWHSMDFLPKYFFSYFSSFVWDFEFWRQWMNEWMNYSSHSSFRIDECFFMTNAICSQTPQWLLLNKTFPTSLHRFSVHFAFLSSLTQWYQFKYSKFWFKVFFFLIFFSPKETPICSIVYRLTTNSRIETIRTRICLSTRMCKGEVFCTLW